MELCHGVYAEEVCNDAAEDESVNLLANVQVFLFVILVLLHALPADVDLKEWIRRLSRLSREAAVDFALWVEEERVGGDSVASADDQPQGSPFGGDESPSLIVYVGASDF